MNCADAGRWSDALLDGELDLKNDAEVREHLEGCAACKQRYEVKRALSANMRRMELGYTAPESLRARIAAALEAEAAGGAAALTAPSAPTATVAEVRGASASNALADAPALAAQTPNAALAGGASNAAASTSQEALNVVPLNARAASAAHALSSAPALAVQTSGGGASNAAASTSRAAPNVTPLNAPARAARRGPGRWLALAGWPVALAASAMLATVMLQQRTQVADDIVSAHVRSLLVDHLNDVVSSSHHTVKPWFAGKIDFSPPVPDLSSLGFELVGGRLDYVEHRPAAALVYRKHGHIINVLVSRDGANIPQTARVQGYSLRSWQQSGLSFVAVSDIDPLELNTLQQGFEMPPQPSPEPPGVGLTPSR